MKIFNSKEYKEYEKEEATRELQSRLEKGEESAKEKGWLPVEDVEKALGMRHSLNMLVRRGRNIPVSSYIWKR